MPLDDYTLAAFLSGELPERERRTVAAALLNDRAAREVLHMACEALAVAFETPDGRQSIRERVGMAPARPRIAGFDRAARTSSARRSRGVS